MKQIRKESPPSFSDYRKYKPFLRQDFDYKCAYCDSTEPEIGGKNRTHIDHYKPKEKFPKLATIYRNLFYACPECNQSKKDYWPTFRQRLAKQIILNPCDHEVSKHFDRSAARWKGRTQTGKWNMVKLLLASDEQVRRRENRAALLELIDELVDQLKSAKLLCDSARKKANTPDVRATTATIDKLKRQVEVFRAKLYAPEQLRDLPALP